jgi:serine/threonine protein kinase
VQLSPEECDARILAELGEHPNIISFFGFYHEYPDTTIVTGLAENGSLYDYLHKDRKVPPLELSLKWARQIAYGVAYIHKLGIVHRDLKSSNVLFTADFEAQICDFGVSRSMPNTTEQSKEAGTRRWMAPEIVKRERINNKCDVFSFSMVVWELMENKVPFYEYVSDVMASMRIIEGERPPITAKWPDYLARLTQDSWSPDSHYRPSFSEIITSLENKVYFRR